PAISPPTPPALPTGHGGGGPAVPSASPPSTGRSPLDGLLRPIRRLLERADDGPSPTGHPDSREPKPPNVVRNDPTSGTQRQTREANGTGGARKSGRDSQSGGSTHNRRGGNDQ